ncbi:MAG TPA: ABC transporter permease [Gemmatimonadaceae bacterium]|nr:ABC transporter permease [Gemmatimonadaceae bacterium]
MKRAFHLSAGRGGTSRDVEHELAFHLEMRTRELVALGRSESDARREALAAFGDISAVRAACLTVQGKRTRERGRTEFMQTLWQDLRVAARTLRRAPAFTLASLVTLALGIGATTAIFSVIDGVLVRPLPYANGDRLVHVNQPANAGAVPDIGFSAMEVADYESQTHTFDAMAEYHSMAFTLLGKGEPRRVQTGVVSADFFDVLGVKPLLGRTFRPGEDQPGATPVIVVSYEFWQRALGGDPGIVGRTFTMNDRVHTVIGVLPFLPQDPDHNDIYMPISSCPFRMSKAMLDSRIARMVTILARLEPGVSLARASADVAGVSARLHHEYPDAYKAADRIGIGAVMYRDEITRGSRPTLIVLLATAGFVLLIACANVANLTLARELRREREMALRAVLGAGRRRIARQLVTESLLLALIGGALGLAVAYAMLGALVSFTAMFTPRASEIAMNGRALAFAFAISALTGVVLGLIPALTSRRDLASGLKEDGTGSTLGGARVRVRGALIAAQVSIAFMLMVGAGLLLRSFVNLERVDPGFDPANILTARVDLNWTKYKNGPAVRTFEEALVGRLAARPGVTGVAVSNASPMTDGQPNNASFRIDGRPIGAGQTAPTMDVRIASPDYFRTLGIALVSGRTFTAMDRDTANEPVVVNQTAARRYWGGANPIGARLTFDDGKYWATVVGIVGDVTQYGPAQQETPALYAPFAISTFSDMRVLVRTRGDPAFVSSELRAIVHDLDPTQPVTEVQTLEQLRGNAVATPRITLVLIGAFAIVALVITAAGLAGVIAFTVSRRTREIGIRVALGAQPSGVRAMVLGQGMRLVAVGLVIGAGAALALTRLMSGFLFHVRATDPATFFGMAALFCGIAALACLIPARRATRVDPMIALRDA